VINDEAARPACVERFGRVAAFVHVRGSGVSLDIVLDDRTVVGGIALGSLVAGRALGERSTLLGVRRRDVLEQFVAVSGKAVGPRSVEHAESVLAFAEPDGTRWELVLRVAADGVAWRYRLPLLDGVTTIEGERSTVALDSFERLWPLEYQTWYETPRFGIDAHELADGDYGLPLLARTPHGDHVLLTESGIDGRFSGSHVRAEERGLRIVPADAAIEVTRGEVSPWRVVIVGTLADIVESHLVDELAPDPAPGIDFGWVRPGRAAWSWWSDFYSGAQLDEQRRFVDDAAALGWEHLLIDCGWDATWVPDIVAYASRRGIQVHLWTVWRDLNGPENLRRLALWRSWGVAGIKVDFMESESKDRYRWYDALLAEAARVGLMVNVHGSVIPRGWARTWPHLIGYEAARGAEYYVFYEEAMSPEHNVILPFSRNVVGAMDYTPVAFSAPTRLTSDAHELALSVAFECGITHFADDTATYRARPLVERFLSELAPIWHETRLLVGDPDGFVAIARRHGERWFVGVIAAGEARSVEMPLERLGLGAADAWLIEDSDGGLVERSEGFVTSLSLALTTHGGAVAIVTPVGRSPFEASPRAVVAAPVVEPLVGEIGADGTIDLTVTTGAALRVPPGWRAQAHGNRWTVTAPAVFDIGVITVELPGDDGVPVVAHARVLPRLAVGRHRVSALPFLAFRNESGPVERDSSNGGGNPADGQRMTVAGVQYEHGLGVSAPSWVRLHLGGRAATFTADVGVDDETTAGWEVFGGRRSVDSATAEVSVVVDGVEQLRRNVVSGEPAASVSVDLTGAQTLELRATSDSEAHIDWANALITVTAADGGPELDTDHR
jgi:hypothetical protein